MHLLVILFFIANISYSQVSDDKHKFQMTGFYRPEQLGPLPSNQFTLRWNEVDNQIKGVYTDSYYSPFNEAPVVGRVLESGRSFNVIYPDIVRGVKTVEILTPMRSLSTGTATSTISLKDTLGQAIGVYTVPVLLSADPTAAEIADANDPSFSCVVGMGALTGYCGEYGGTITKYSDNAGNCQFLINSAKLQLTNTGDFVFLIPPEAKWSAIGYGEITTLKHYIGGLNANAPVSTTVDVSRKQCDELPGTNFPPETCLTLRLVGTFRTLAGEKSFSGSYTIQDENNNSCTYSLNLERPN